MKKSTRNLLIAVLAAALLLLGIGLTSGRTGYGDIEWQPASYYAAAAQGGSTNSLYA